MMAGNDAMGQVDPFGASCIAITSRAVIHSRWGHYALELLRGCCPAIAKETKYKKWMAGQSCITKAEKKVELLNTGGVTAEFNEQRPGESREKWKRRFFPALMGIAVINYNVTGESTDAFANIFDESDGDIDHKWEQILAAARVYEYAEQGADGRQLTADKIKFEKFPKSVYHAFGNNSNLFVRQMIFFSPPGIRRVELTNKVHPPDPAMHLFPEPDGGRHVTYAKYRNPKAGWR